MGELLSVLVDEGLGNAAYLVDLGGGRALAVDPSTDLRALRQVADRRRLKVAFVAETHLHADFLSGACELAATEEATILAPRDSGRAFDHIGMGDGDEIDLGGLRLQAMSTPGHTDEHTAYLLLDAARPLGVFSGGSMLVDGAARTDLVAPDRAEELARRQYASYQRLLALPDETALWPTHGAGSFCAAPPGPDRTSTIGYERTTGSLAAVKDEDAFVRQLLGPLGTFPPYFLRLPELNRLGPRAASDRLRQLDVEEVEHLQALGAIVVDVRTMRRFAAGHLPGALSIELRPAFATWLGWLVPAERPVVVVRDLEQDAAELEGQAGKVGVALCGELRDGVDAWADSGRPLVSTPMREPSETTAEDVVDVRQANEFAAGHVAGARHLELGSITRSAPAGPVVLMCGHGERAMTGASLLQAAGRDDVAVLVGGPRDWARSHGATDDSTP